MDKSLIWLLVPGAFAIVYYIQVSARHRQLSYDLVEYLLAGKRLSSARFILATTTISLLGIMSLPHMGLLYRSGFSYGLAALAAIIVPLTSALFARRLWVLGRIFTPLTAAQLLGDYYASKGLRLLIALTAILIALTLSVMTLRFGAALVQGIGGSSSLLALATMGAIAALLFFHTAFGGMGAIMRISSRVGIILVVALVVATLVCIDALGGFAGFIDHLVKLQYQEINAPLFMQGAFFDPTPAAAPANMAWPGTMVLTSLLALIGLACAPASVMLSFTPAKAQAHATQQFFAAALLSGLVLFTTTIIIALTARLSHEIAGFSTNSQLISPTIGSEPQTIMALLLATPLGNPLLIGFIALALLAGLIASTSAALLTAGGILASDIFYERLKRSHQLTRRKSITRYAIGLFLGVALLIAWQKPGDPLPLFLLAGAFGLQLLPALTGLCYFEKLTGDTVRNGLFAGLLGVVATSAIAQGLTGLVGGALPFDAWPLSLHPAFWGLATNIVAMGLTGLAHLTSKTAKAQNQTVAHRLSYHILPDQKPLMAPDAPKWRLVALLTGALFVFVTAIPFSGTAIDSPKLHELFFLDALPSFMPPLWSWQFLSWIIGLALVYITAYRLQPVFDPEQDQNGSSNPLRRRFRVKARSRKRV